MEKIRSRLFLLLGFIHFLLNVFLLIPPLTYTSLVSIVWFPKLLKNKSILKYLGLIFLIFLYYALIHFFNGVEWQYYIKSSLFMCFIVVSTIAMYSYLKENIEKIPILFRYLPFAIFGVFLLGIVFYLSDYSYLFWKQHTFVEEGHFTPRFLGLTYEPSYFALSIAPIFVYSLLKVLFNVSIRNLGVLLMVSLPIIATLSFGFFITAFLSIVIGFGFVFIRYREFKRILIYPFILIFISVIAISITDSSISKRFDIILEGNDSSVNGRTSEAFYLAYQCAKQKSVLLGIGPGQIKVIGEDVIRPYYSAWAPIGYSKENWPILSIPNSSAETLAIYGIIGLIIRFSLQIFLFFRFKVYQNYFNLILFLFIFIYQLMGSFITSSIEYVIWIFAILPIFQQFQIKSDNKLSELKE